MGRVLRIENKFKGAEDGYWRRVHFEILKDFKGASGSRFVLLTSPWEAACGLHVKKGEVWIVYANFNDVDNVFRSFRGHKYAKKDDQEYLHFLNQASAGQLDTSISGQLIPAGLFTVNSYAGVEIGLVKNGDSKLTTTDSDGKFMFSSLSAGSYRVQLRFPYRASVMWIYSKPDFLYTSDLPTVFEYSVLLHPGECDYKFFEVSKRSRQ